MTTTKKKAKGTKGFFYISRDPVEVPYHDPKRAYYDMDEARTAAEGLARTTGHRFYLMAAIGFVEPKTPPVAWSVTDLKTDEFDLG